jgi:hypothetical protein
MAPEIGVPALGVFKCARATLRTQELPVVVAVQVIAELIFILVWEPLKRSSAGGTIIYIHSVVHNTSQMGF